jgi:hypothetical protein
MTMGFGRLLKVGKAQFEKVLLGLIKRKNYNVHYSYTNMDYYISGDEATLNILQQAVSH